MRQIVRQEGHDKLEFLSTEHNSLGHETKPVIDCPLCDVLDFESYHADNCDSFLMQEDCVICQHIRQEPHLAEICTKCDVRTNPEKPKFQDFRYGKYTWSINKAEKLISKRPKSAGTITINVEQVYDSIKWQTEEAPVLGVRVNEEYAMTKADLSKPLIFGLIKVEEKWFNILIDGHHRLYRAKHEGIKTLKAYILNKAENKNCLIGPFTMPGKR